MTSTNGSVSNMIFGWRENNDFIRYLLNSTSNKNYMDQVEWTSVANLRNDSALDNTPIGLVAMNHKNFTKIIDSILSRSPNTTFHYFEETIAEMKDKLNYHQQPCPNSSGATLEEQSVALSIEFIFGVILQAMVGGFGVMGNVCAIGVILKSRKLRSVFNYILVCSLVIHTGFILSALTIEVYKKVGGKTFGEIFCHFLYAFRPMLLHSTTFLTVLMARERLRAVQDPIAYRNDCLSRNEWVKPLIYSLNSLIVAGIFVIPLFWESEVEGVRTIRHVSWNSTHDMEESTISYKIAVTAFRMDHRYILWYKNIATFLVTLFIPLNMLIYYNVNTYRRIRERSLRRVTTVSNEIIKREEEFKARFLFVIIIIFFLCNSLRFVINFEECLAQRDYNYAEKHNCHIHPFWSIVMNHCSQFLITVNASLGFVIYCFMSSDFRMAFRQVVAKDTQSETSHTLQDECQM